jgi:hypothetical protein
LEALAKFMPENNVGMEAGKKLMANVAEEECQQAYTLYTVSDNSLPTPDLWSPADREVSAGDAA